MWLLNSSISRRIPPSHHDWQQGGSVYTDGSSISIRAGSRRGMQSRAALYRLTRTTSQAPHLNPGSARRVEDLLLLRSTPPGHTGIIGHHLAPVLLRGIIERCGP